MTVTEAASIGLRDYQQEAVAAVLDGYDRGVQRQIVALATGTGKTVVGVAIAAQRRGRTLFLVHTDELVQQTAEKFSLWLPDVPVGIVKAERDDVLAPIIVASIQTLARSRRLGRLMTAARQMGGFRTIVTDEAHHAVARTWLQVLYGVGAFDLDQLAMAEQAEAARLAGKTGPLRLIPHKGTSIDGPLVVGLTATPERGDGLALDVLWQRIAYQRAMLDMILAGWLCDLTPLAVGTEHDLSGVKTVAGDFDEGALGAALIAQGVPDELAAAYETYAQGRKAIVFVPTIAMAQVTADAFRSRALAAEFITGKTPLEDRRRMLAALRAGALAAVVNVGVLTEGFDAPVVDCIIVGRPTQSRPLYTQIIGRGTRPYPGKRDCLVLELISRNTRHKIVTVDDLLGRPKRTGAGPQRGEETPQRAGKLDRVDTTGALNLFASAAWVALGDGRFYLAVPGGGVELRPADAETYAIVHRTGPRETPLYDRPLRIDYAQGIVEDMIRRNRWTALTNPHEPWRQRPATEKQLVWLRRIAADVRAAEVAAEAAAALEQTGLSADAASRLITAYQALGLPREG